jgi:hypothetical protein
MNASGPTPPPLAVAAAAAAYLRLAYGAHQLMRGPYQGLLTRSNNLAAQHSRKHKKYFMEQSPTPDYWRLRGHAGRVSCADTRSTLLLATLDATYHTKGAH